MEDAAHWLAGSAFVHTQDFLPSGGTIHSGLDPPHQSLTRKMLVLACRTTLRRHFPY